MTRTHDRGLLVAGLILVTASLFGGLVPGTGWSTHMGTRHGTMMGGWEGSGAASPIPGAAEVTVTASEFSFSPAAVTVTAGQPVDLTLTNAGSLPHDLVAAELGVHLAARPGQGSTVGLTPTEPGTYEMACTYPGHAVAGMRATLTVVAP